MRRDVVGYTLRSKNDKILYVGITNNPRAREAEHRLGGKRFEYLNVETKPMSRGYAEKWETKRLASYRGFVGHNPPYNRTDDGKYSPELEDHRVPTSRGSGCLSLIFAIVLVVCLVVVPFLLG